MADLAEALKAVLARHLSAMSAESVLARACDRAGADRTRLRPRQLEAVVQELRRGVGLFCPESRLPALMLDLAELVERETTEE